MKSILILIEEKDIRIYKQFDNDIKLIEKISIDFNRKLNINSGFGKEYDQFIYELLEDIEDEYKEYKVIVYVKELFSKVDINVRDKYKKYFKEYGFDFKVLNLKKELEYKNKFFYNILEQEFLLLEINNTMINISILKENICLEKYNICINIDEIIKESIKNMYNNIGIEVIIHNIIKKLPDIKSNTNIAIFNGDKIKYYKKIGYKIFNNDVFNNKSFLYKIKFKDYEYRNIEVFKNLKVSKDDLFINKYKKAVPYILAQAIFKKYNILNIIPICYSIIDGIVKKQDKKVKLIK